jgi:hypothetical protein
MKAGISILFFFCCFSSFSQTTRPGPPIYLRDVFRTRIDPKPYASIKGSPFVDDHWLLARIKAEGRNELIDSLYIKINVYTNGVHFIDENGEEMRIDLRIEKITIIDSSSALYKTDFLSNFNQEKGFFRVIADGGQAKLLKKLRIFIWEVQPLGSEVIRTFEVQDDLYLCFGTQLFKPTKSCIAIRNAFGNNEKVFDYITANRLFCNKEEDIKKIVNYYSTLK